MQFGLGIGAGAEKVVGAVKSPLKQQRDAIRGMTGEQGSGTTKSKSESQLGKNKAHVDGASFGRGASQKKPGIDRLLKDAGGGQQGTGDNLPNVPRVEIETIVQLVSEVQGPGPGRELAELRLNDGTGLIFDGAADNGAVTPELSGKREASAHRFLLSFRSMDAIGKQRFSY